MILSQCRVFLIKTLDYVIKFIPVGKVVTDMIAIPGDLKELCAL